MDEAAKEAWTLVDMLIENRDQHDVCVDGKGFYESCAWHIAKALREAEERGRREEWGACAEVAKNLPFTYEDAEEISDWPSGFMAGVGYTCEAIAKAIQARGGE